MMGARRCECDIVNACERVNLHLQSAEHPIAAHSQLGERQHSRLAALILQERGARIAAKAKSRSNNRGFFPQSGAAKSMKSAEPEPCLELHSIVSSSLRHIFSFTSIALLHASPKPSSQTYASSGISTNLQSDNQALAFGVEPILH